MILPDRSLLKSSSGFFQRKWCSEIAFFSMLDNR
jgi:hypothetical protein